VRFVASTRSGVSAYSTPKGLFVTGAAIGEDVPTSLLYDATTKTWSAAASPSAARYEAATTTYVPLTKSTGGRVLVSGGATSDGTVLSSVEIYDPATNSWAPTTPMTSPRRGHTVTQLADGSLLVTGGTTDGTTPVGASESFSPAALGSPCTASGDCYSGFCTDGVCCSIATCGAGRACTADGTSCSAAKGVSCTSDAECASTHCANGVCCDTACDGVCQACNLEATKGTCTSLGASCLGEPADASPVGDAGGGDGGAPVIHEAFTHCTKGSDCSTGTCVEGVCCDTPCTDVCHSCALTGSIGKCTLEPLGVDLKHECGPGRSCLGTCGGDGTCVGATTGTQCETSRCTGASTGVGPAVCASAGGACQLDQVAPFDCAPYVCEPAFGACRSACTSSDQCAQGGFCDTSTQTCVAAPPSGGGGGCAYSSGGGAGAFALAGAIAALGLVARRRRAS
jgi:hypothetical protein